MWPQITSKSCSHSLFNKQWNSKVIYKIFIKWHPTRIVTIGPHYFQTVCNHRKGGNWCSSWKIGHPCYYGTTDVWIPRSPCGVWPAHLLSSTFRTRRAKCQQRNRTWSHVNETPHLLLKGYNKLQMVKLGVWRGRFLSGYAWQPGRLNGVGQVVKVLWWVWKHLVEIVRRPYVARTLKFNLKYSGFDFYQKNILNAVTANRYKRRTIGKIILVLMAVI